MASNTQRIETLEQHVGKLLDLVGDYPDVCTRLQIAEEALQVFGELPEFMCRIESLEKGLQEVLLSLPEGNLEESINGIRTEMHTMNVKLNLVCQAVANTPAGGTKRPKVKVPEPKSFNGARDARELENFIFDMEQYFRAVEIEDEGTKVSMTTMYLTESAKLWWRTRYNDIAAGNSENIDTWEQLKEDLRTQFLPENTALNARQELFGIKQTGNIRDYVKAFSTVLLDIHDMSDPDKLFYFTQGLQQWHRTELNRRQVKTFAQAISAAESLQDYRSNNKAPAPRNDQGKNGGEEKSTTFTKSSNRNNEGGRPYTPPNNYRNKNRGTSSSQASSAGSHSPSFSCHLCGGPHAMANCPDKQLLNALYSKTGLASPMLSVSEHEQEKQEDHTESKECECVDCQKSLGALQISPTQYCNAITEVHDSKPKEKMHQVCKKKQGANICSGKGLMFVDVKINGKQTRAMVDTGATHNYISCNEVQRLGLVVEQGLGRVKAINSEAKPIAGMVKNVQVKVGPYAGRTNFSVVEMDDFQVLFGLEFLRETDSVVNPYTNSIIMVGKHPCVIRMNAPTRCQRYISSLQMQRDSDNCQNKLTRASTALVGEDVTGSLPPPASPVPTPPSPCSRPCVAPLKRNPSALPSSYASAPAPAYTPSAPAPASTSSAPAPISTFSAPAPIPVQHLSAPAPFAARHFGPTASATPPLTIATTTQVPIYTCMVPLPWWSPFTYFNYATL